MASENPSTPPPVVRESIWVEEPSRRRVWLNWIVFLGLLAFLMWVLKPRTMCGPRNADQSQAMSNARQFGMALFEFESDYGAFPNAATAQLLKDKGPPNLALGDRTSNELFRQLLVTRIVESEGIFYAKGKGTRRPDGKCDTETDALAKGECGFAYIPGATPGDSGRPIAVCPVLPGTHKFDPKPFNGKAIVLLSNNSVQAYQIRPDGEIAGRGGKLLDPSQRYWEGKTPEIKWPDLLPVDETPDYVPWICIGVIAAVLIITFIGACRHTIKRWRLPTNEPTPEDA